MEKGGRTFLPQTQTSWKLYVGLGRLRRCCCRVLTTCWMRPFLAGLPPYFPKAAPVDRGAAARLPILVPPGARRGVRAIHTAAG